MNNDSPSIPIFKLPVDSILSEIVCGSHLLMMTLLLTISLHLWTLRKQERLTKSAVQN